MPYEFLEHAADVRFRASGESLEKLFASAGEAYTEVILDPESIRETEKELIEFEANDLEELLRNWLEELVYLFSAKLKVFKRFEVEKVKSIDGKYVLVAKAIGEEADTERHVFDTEVKGVSYHGMDVEKKDNGWEATVLLDV